MSKKALVNFPLILLSVLGLIACGKHGMMKSPSTASNVSGSVVYSQPASLQPNETLHVILTDVTLPDAPRTIAEPTINRPGPAPTPFTVHYDSSQINPSHDYSIQACIRSDAQVRFVTARDYPVVTKGHAVSVNVILEPNANPRAQFADSSFSAGSDDPPLQRSVQATLAGVCGVVDARCDHITRARASEILLPELLSGLHYKVREDVVIRGPQYFFVVDSDFGQYQVGGDDGLRFEFGKMNSIHRKMHLRLYLYGSKGPCRREKSYVFNSSAHRVLEGRLWRHFPQKSPQMRPKQFSSITLS